MSMHGGEGTGDSSWWWSSSMYGGEGTGDGSWSMFGGEGTGDSSWWWSSSMYGGEGAGDGAGLCSSDDESCKSLIMGFCRKGRSLGLILLASGWSSSDSPSKSSSMSSSLGISPAPSVWRIVSNSLGSSEENINASISWISLSDTVSLEMLGSSSGNS